MLGRAIRQFREARGWKQAALAAKAGVTQSYISNLERGARAGSLDALQAIAAALGVSLEQLRKAAEVDTARPEVAPVQQLRAVGWPEAELDQMVKRWPGLEHEQRLELLAMAEKLYISTQAKYRRMHEMEQRIQWQRAQIAALLANEELASEPELDRPT